MLREGAAIDRDERLAVKQTLFMHRSGDQFLAATGFAADENRAVGRSDLGHQFADNLHGVRCPHQLGQLRSRGAFHPFEVRSFLFHPSTLSDPSEQLLQFREAARLAQVIDDTKAQGSDGGLERSLAGEHNRLRAGRQCHRPLDDLDTIHARHVQIDDEAVELLLFERSDRRVPVWANRDSMPEVRKLDTSDFLKLFFVVGE